ncbi:hypothetical protein AVEN_173642-1 [Araneus ventricosus]|uniref:Secreted protein n=1 Tax=Araneus ventricosus TaxID=182803 RepID=A0A4Y2MHR7_ARAVE|nr:hypothetical protein AVEN_173642-1 [Araneus ventricosus]
MNWFGRLVLVVVGVGCGVRALSILCPFKTDEVDSSSQRYQGFRVALGQMTDTPMHYSASYVFTLSWHMKPPAIQFEDQWFKNAANNKLSRKRFKLIIKHIHEYEFLFRPES